MQLKDYIKDTIDELKDITNNIEFDIGIDNNMEVNNSSLNRIKFEIRKNKGRIIKE
jgi:hypothetical protein